MRITRTAAVGMSIFMLSASVASAADGKAEGTAGPTAGQTVPTVAKTEPASAKTEPTAGQGGSKAIKDAIVGSWKCAADGEVMEFAADGSARVKDPNAMFLATYNLLDDGRLHLEVPVFGKQKDLTYTVELTGDELTLTFKDQQPRKYNRVK